jgi:hypothetical protein
MNKCFHLTSLLLTPEINKIQFYYWYGQKSDMISSKILVHTRNYDMKLLWRKSTFFWNMTPYNFLKRHQCCGKPSASIFRTTRFVILLIQNCYTLVNYFQNTCTLNPCYSRGLGSITPRRTKIRK